MTFLVLLNANGGKVVADLTMVCGSDPSLTISAVATPITDPTTGATITVMPSGMVAFSGPAPAAQSRGNNIVRQLVALKDALAIVQGEDASFLVAPGVRLMDNGGTMDGARVPTPGTAAKTHTIYDASGCLGLGYWVYDSAGTKIANPSHVMLMHELGHAFHFVKRTDTAGAEEIQAATVENSFRVELGLPMRSTGTNHHDGGPNCTAPATPATPATPTPPAPSSGRGSRGCVVATAAYESPTAPPVERLRSFRDNIMSATRAGREYVDRFERYYYSFSPLLAESMRVDSEMKEVVRHALAEPITNFLTYFLDFPDATLDGVPEPWRSFLASQRARLENWACEATLPASVSGMPTQEAARELAIVLRYALRTPESRMSWITGLRQKGGLPLAGSPEDLAAAVEILRGAGISGELAQSIVGEAGDKSGHANFGPNENTNFMQTNPLIALYSVRVVNDSGPPLAPPITFDVVLFYKRRGQSGVVFWKAESIGPGESCMLPCGPTGELESYSFGVFAYMEVNGQLEYQMIASLPGDLATEPPITPAEAKAMQQAAGRTTTLHADTWFVGS